MIKSLQRHAAYQTEYYARLRQLPPFGMLAPIIEGFLRMIVDDGAFYLRVRREHLPLILQSGSIKSMTETGTGATMGGVETRKEVTHLLFDCDTAHMAAADYPKFGYLSTANVRRELFGGDEMSYQYGNALFKLRKERLMHRTTLTVGTSLSPRVTTHIVPTRTDTIMATCLPGLPTDKGQKAPAEMALQLYAYFADAVLRRRITKENYFRITETLGCDVPYFEFFELQYHGQISLADDVESLSLYVEDDQPFVDEMKTVFEAKGVKVSVESF